MKTHYFKTLVALLLFGVCVNAQVSPRTQLKKEFDNIAQTFSKKDSLEFEKTAQKQLDKLNKIKKNLENKRISDKKFERKVERLIADLNNSSDNNTNYNSKEDLNDTIIVTVRKYINNKLSDSTSYDSAKAEAKKYLPFYFRVYSDAKGFKKEQPNGLLQTEFGFNWEIKALTWSSKNCKVYFLKNLQLPQVSLFQNKNDTSFQYTPVHYDKSIPITDTTLFTSRLNVHTLNLIKYAHYTVSGKLNLLAVEYKKKGIKWYLDAFGTFYSTGISYDSTTYKLLQIKKEDSKFQVFSAGGGLNSKLIICPPKTYFTLEVSYTQFYLLLLNNDIRQSYGKLHTPDYNSSNYKTPLIRSYNDKSLSAIAIYNVEVRYSSTRNDKKKDNTGVFLRFNFFTNPFTSFSFKSNYGNNYTQIQVGVSHTFEELLNFLGMEKPK